MINWEALIYSIVAVAGVAAMVCALMLWSIFSQRIFKSWISGLISAVTPAVILLVVIFYISFSGSFQ